MTAPELWRDVPGMQGHYQVSNLGRVKSLKFNKERILKKRWNGMGGYAKHVQVALCLNGVYHYWQVARLVAEVWLGHPGHESEWMVKHLSDDPTDNRPENLRWLQVKR